MNLEMELTQANCDLAWAKCKLEAMKTGHAIAKSDASMVEEAQ